MKAWFFTEAAYPDLPSASSYDSVRVTLPNRLLDPETAASRWDDYLAEWQEASELGINIMVNEHHSTATCMNAAVPITAGILSRLTSKTRLLVLGNPIANRPDPVRVAEEMAMVDIFSRGRLEVGFVRGVPFELAATNTRPTTMSERFWEAHDLIKEAWVSHDGPISWQGRFFEHRQVNIWPRPYQDPHPPIWITSGSRGSAIEVGRRGYVCATFLTGVEGTKKVFDGYQAGWSEARGGEVPPDRLAYAALIYTGETDAEGLAGAEKLIWYISSNKVPRQFSNPPGYLPPAIRAAAQRGQSPFALRGLSLEQLIDRGAVFAGSPSTVVGQIERFQEGTGPFGHLLVMGQAGHLDRERTIAGLRLLAGEVLPRI
jgi:alkanesulfonate monooxygenase SsuD/methylene tetrahydromethanopterin reductase-like flavin-dependent oxidoreductase (luciferase family)